MVWLQMTGTAVLTALLQLVAASLLPLFFAYAGFESLAQTAGEVKQSTTRLPRVFLRGIGVATGIFFLMSAVAFGVLPGSRLGSSTVAEPGQVTSSR